MGILDRLGNVINSYINDMGTERPFRSSSYSADPDLNAAYEELDDYLNRKEARSGGSKEKNENTGIKLPPEQLRPDFDCLGVPFGAGADECKAAYKKLLQIHHPDRHAKHEGNFKKATEKSVKINSAWKRIEEWRASGNIT